MMNDVDRVKVALYQYLFSQESNAVDRVETARRTMQRRSGEACAVDRGADAQRQELDATVRFLFAQVELQHLKTIEKRVFDILRNF